MRFIERLCLDLFCPPFFVQSRLGSRLSSDWFSSRRWILLCCDGLRLHSCYDRGGSGFLLEDIEVFSREIRQRWRTDWGWRFCMHLCLCLRLCLRLRLCSRLCLILILSLSLCWFGRWCLFWCRFWSWLWRCFWRCRRRFWFSFCCWGPTLSLSGFWFWSDEY